MSGPLAGVRVLDLTTVVMGPYATQVLGDYGADVIKVEPPDGDVMRRAGPMRNPGMGHLYLTANRNKRSIVLDLKQSRGRDVVLRMAAQSDVLVYNIRPQAMARLGLSYEDVKAVAPQLVYAGAFGFSQRGPYAARPAYDDLIQGMCAIPWLNQQASGESPRYAPMVLVDRIAGLQLCTAITSALFHRQRTGQGQRVDVPMFEGMLSVVLGEHLAGELFEPPVAGVGYQRSLARDRRPYETKDGFICVLVYNDKQWRALFDALGEPELFDTDFRFASQGSRLEHIDHVYGYLSDVLRGRTTDEWLAICEAADIPAARMYSLHDILSDQHLAAIGYFQRRYHPTEGWIRDTAVPTEWSVTQPAQPRPAPGMGQHGAEVLRQFGYSEEEITQLKDQGTLGP